MAKERKVVMRTIDLVREEDHDDLLLTWSGRQCIVKVLLLVGFSLQNNRY